MQHSSTGHEHFELGATCQQRCYLDGGCNDLLKVVQEQQQFFFLQPCPQSVRERLTGRLSNAKRLSYGGDDQRRIAEGARFTKKKPSRNSPRSLAAVCKPRRVLPVPP